MPLRVKVQGASHGPSLARRFRIEGEAGASFSTPVYSLDLSWLVGDRAIVSPASLRGRNLLIEVHATPQSLGARLTTLKRLIYSEDAEFPFYIALHPASLRDMDGGTLATLLEKALNLLGDTVSMLAYTAVEASAFTRAVKVDTSLCIRANCVPVLAPTSRREALAATDDIERLWNNVPELPQLAAVWLPRSSLLSINRRRRLQPLISKAVSEAIPLMLYGPRRARPLRSTPWLNAAETLLQYHMAADIIGPPRSPSPGPAPRGDRLQRKMILLPRLHHYLLLNLTPDADTNLQELLAEELAAILGTGSTQEARQAPPSRLEEANLDAILAYTAELREGDPNTILERAIELWKEHQLHETVELVLESLQSLKPRESLDQYLRENGR